MEIKLRARVVVIFPTTLPLSGLIQCFCCNITSLMAVIISELLALLRSQLSTICPPTPAYRKQEAALTRQLLAK